MREAFARGSGTQHDWTDAVCAAVLMFSAQLHVCASHAVWKPISRRQVGTPISSEHGAPFPAGGRSENDTRKIWLENYLFRVDQVNSVACG